MALDTFNPYLFVSSGEQSNKFLTPKYADGIAQFQAQRAQSLTGLTVRIDPIQEGTGDPSPTNIRPISGRTGMTVTTRAGKNLGELVEGTKVSSQNCTVTYKEGGVSVVATGRYGRSGYVIPVVKGKHYTVSFKCKRVGNPYSIQVNNVADWGYAYRVYTSSDMPANDFGKKSFSFVANTDVLFVGVYPQAVDTGIYIEEFQIETGDTATAYEPYDGQAYPISWQTEAGTVYGGTLDAVSGVLTVDRGYYTITDADSPVLFQTGTNANRVGVVVNGSALSPTVADRLNIMSNIAKADTLILTQSQQAVGTCCLYSAGADTASKALFGVPTTEDTAAKAKAWLIAQGCAFVYPLATPQTYQLTGAEVRTITGFNQIYSDAGPVIDIKF